jgi:DNA invertase Pin-like site-specific DNA recombinase
VREHADKDGLNVVKIFSDNGCAGLTLNRPRLDAAFEYVSKGVKSLIVITHDRIARGLSRLANTISRFSAAGTQFMVVNEHDKAMTSMAKADSFPRLALAIAELEVEALKRRSSMASKQPKEEPDGETNLG